MAEAGTATATIVFTDVVGSTEVRTRLGEVASDRLFRDHERRLADVVAAHRGRVVKLAGDGIMAAFDAASDAVAATVAMQHEVAVSSPELQIRVGAAAGDVSWEGGDCFGLPVVVAARLASEASGGQILVSRVVRWLAGDRAGGRYHHLGPMELRGLDEPVDVCEVGWDPPAPGRGDNSPGAVPLPPPLRSPGSFTFVGRAEEWTALMDAWSDVRAGGQRMVLLGGEAGAGKTRLAAEFARQCHAEGGVVLFGGCDDELALPYQPWVQAMEHLVRSAPDELLVGDAEHDLAELALLVPEVERRIEGASRPTGSDHQVDRYRLFSAVVSFFARIAGRQPTVLLLDDLHWAGAQTLALLRHVVRSSAAHGLLVIATFRDTGDQVTDSLASCLADLRRVDDVIRVRVDALDSTSIEELVAGATGSALDTNLRELAASLAERSGGNAFYLCELWRHLVNVGVITRTGDRWTVSAPARADGVPESVKDVVGARLTRLSPAARAIVELASVTGPRIEGRVLRHATDLTDDALDGALDELVEAGLLADGPGLLLTYGFPHALLRDAVEDTVPLRSRARLHLRIAEALEGVHEADRRPVLADLARHFAASASHGGVAKAVYYGRRAGLQALRSVAYDEAVSHLETATALATDLHEQMELRLDLGRAQLRGGRYAASESTYRTAFGTARKLAAPACAAQAAIGFEQATHMPGLPGDEAVVIVTEAQSMLDDDLSPLGVRLQAALARAYAHAGRPDDALRAMELALTRARDTDDTDSQGAALEAALIATLDDPHRVLALARELETVAVGSADPWHLLYATSNELRALVELGRLDEAAAVLARHRAQADQARSTAFQFIGEAFDVVLALAAGRFGEAEAAAERAHALGAASDTPFEAGVYGLQMFALRREQGRLDEVAPVLRLVADRDDDAQSLWRPGLAALFADLGMLDEARRDLDVLAAGGFASVAHDAVWPACISFLADVCIALRDRDRAATVYEELTPLEGRNLMVGMTICFGPADRYLGNLAALLERPGRADAHFRAALELAERSGSPVWEAHALHDYARFLADREPARAAQLGARAHQIAVVVGMGALAARELPGGSATEVIDGSGAEAATPSWPDGLSGREVEVIRLIAVGRSNREIGEQLHISKNTVANHVRAILQKTGCSNRAEAAAYAARSSLLG